MRKLATAAIAFSAAVFAANYIFAPDRLLLPGLIICSAGAALSALRRKWLRPAVTAMIFFGIGLGFFHFYSAATVDKAAEYDGQTHVINAQILEYPDIYEDYNRLEVRITSYYLPSFKAVLYDNDKQLADAKPGDRLELRAKISSADTIFGERYDNYHSKGIYFKLSSRGHIQHQSAFDIFSLPKYVSHWLSDRIELIFPADTALFMRSLMLGDKDDFYDDNELYASMSRAGLMHIVAVSGMHLSFLVGLIHFALGQGRRSALICIVLVWFFAFVTGAGPAVLRAAFMQSCFLMAPVLRRENDAITSMSAILAVILCINPHAAASISLQLSFGAMAGILLFSDRIFKTISKPLGKLKHRKPVSYILACVSCSMAVMVFTMPLTAVHFGSVPLLSPLTNLMSLWAVSLCFCGGWVACALSLVPFAGELCALLCSWLARYIVFSAGLVSSIPFSVLYMQTRGAWLWIFISCVMFVIAPVFGSGMLTGFVLPLTASALLIAGIMYANARFYNETETVNLLDVGQGQCLSVLTDEATVLVDCGNTSSLEDAGTLAAGHLYSRGRRSVDLLILSHLHEDHAGGVPLLMELVDIKTIILPIEYSEDDEIYKEIVSTAKRKGVKLYRVSRDHTLSIGDVDIQIYKSGDSKTENERCLITRLAVEDFEVLAMADSSARTEKELVSRVDLDAVDVLIVPHHGSAYSSSYELLDAVGGDTALISTGYNNYGHPAKETLERLEECGYNVYRTDEANTIEMRIG